MRTKVTKGEMAEAEEALRKYGRNPLRKQEGDEENAGVYESPPKKRLKGEWLTEWERVAYARAWQVLLAMTRAGRRKRFYFADIRSRNRFRTAFYHWRHDMGYMSPNKEDKVYLMLTLTVERGDCSVLVRNNLPTVRVRAVARGPKGTAPALLPYFELFEGLVARPRADYTQVFVTKTDWRRFQRAFYAWRGGKKGACLVWAKGKKVLEARIHNTGLDAEV